MANPNVGQTTAQAWQAYVGDRPADTIFNEYSQLARLEENKSFKCITGGRSVIGTVEYKVNTSVAAISDTEELSTTRIDVFDEFEYSWRQYAGTFVMSTVEEAQNRGSNAKFDLASGKADNLLKSMRRKINTDLFTAQAGVAMLGLPDLVATDPTTGTVGGINRATYTWWRNQQTSGAQTTSAYDNLRSSMRTIHVACSTGMGTNEPEYYLGSSTDVNGYEGLLVANERLIDKRDKGQTNAGIDHDALMFKKAKVVWDKAASSGTMFALNHSNPMLAYQEGKWFKAHDGVRPANQLVEITAVETQVCFFSPNPRHLGVISSIT